MGPAYRCEARRGKVGKRQPVEERVPSLTLKQIMEMQDQLVSATTDQLAREFLEVFEPGKPLDKDGFRGLDTTSQH